MAKYRIEIKNSAIKELNNLPTNILLKIIEKINTLSENPRPKGCVILTGRNRYRIRHGKYRILFSVEDDILVLYVVKIVPRRDVYK